MEGEVYMKKSFLISIIAIVAFVSAIVGTIYVLKKNGLLFNDCCCEFDLDDCCCCKEDSKESIEEADESNEG